MFGQGKFILVANFDRAKKKKGRPKKINSALEKDDSKVD